MTLKIISRHVILHVILYAFYKSNVGK